MSYVDTSRRPSYSSIVAVVAIHAAMGAALITGLAATGVIEEPEIFTGIDIRKPPPPEPPKPIEDPPKPRIADTPDTPIVVPDPIFPLVEPTTTVETTFKIIPPQPPVQPGRGENLTKVLPSPLPSLPAIGAKPRNDPARWVDTDDYRSNWIRQEMTGRARFRLEIAADGKVANCTITGSSGHPELDAATCALVSKRAKFQPARSGSGEAVAGSYSNAIDWRLPE